MAVTSQDIQKLYIAYFNRPADFFGLQFQEAAANATSIEAVAAGFAASTEFQTTYANMSTAQFVNALYNNLFGRDADVGGLQFWVDLLNKGVVTKGNIALNMLNGAINEDAVTVANKVAASEAFYEQLNTAARITAYEDADAQAAAKQWLATIEDDASLAAALDATALNTTVTSIVQAGMPPVPTTTTNLTTGLDAVTGTVGNDIFNGGLENSLSAFDNLNGGAGNDVLNVLFSTATTSLPGGVTVQNIETANINTASTTGFTADVSTWTGLNQLNLSASSQAAGNIVVNGTSGVNVAATGATTGGITVGTTTAPLGAVTIAQNVTVAAGAQAAAINVKGGSTVAVAQNLSTDNAAGTSTGSNVTVTGTAATTNVTVSQTAPVAAVAAVAGSPAVTARTETAAINFTGDLTAGQTVEIGGLTYTSTGATTAAELAAAFANTLNGATPANPPTGTFAGTLAGFNLGAVTAVTGLTATSVTADTDVANITETDAAGIVTVTTTAGRAAAAEVVAVANVTGIAAGGVTVTDANSASTTAAGTITTVSLQNFGNSTVNSGALATLNLSGTGGNVGVTAGALSTAVVNTIALNLNGATAGTVTLDADYKTVNLTSATGNSSATLSASGAKTLNIAGDKNLTLANQTLDAAAAITSTSSANVTLNGTLAAGQSYTGAAGVDTISVAASGTKAITTGAGNDVVTYGGALGTGGSIDGGEGSDTLKMSTAAAVTATGGTTFAGTVSNFEVLALSDVTGGVTAINMANADGINNLSIAGSTVGALTVSNAAAGFTLTQTGASSADINVNLANALGSADVVNLSFSAANGFSNAAAATVVAGVETVNITTTDTDANVANSAAVTAIITAAAATTVNASGNLGLNLSTGMSQTTLTTLNASGLTGTGANGGLTFTSGALAEAATITGSAAGANSVTFTAATKAVTYTGGTGNDAVTANNANANVINLGNGVNSFTGGNGNNNVTGGSGIDTITVGNGSNTIVAGGGADIITVGSGSNTVTLGAGNDTLILSAVNTSSAVFTTVTDLAAGDKIDFTATIGNAAGKLGAMLASGVNDYQTYLNAAAGKFTVGGGTTGAVSWFQFGGDTYIVQDISNSGSFVAGTDTIVKLTGLVDLSNSTVAGTDVLTIA